MNFVREAKTKQLFRSLCIEHSLLKRERTEIAKFQLHFLTQFCVLLKNGTYYFVDTRDTIKKLTLQQRRFQRKSSINRTTINTFQSNQESGVKGSRYIQNSSTVANTYVFDNENIVFQDRMTAQELLTLSILNLKTICLQGQYFSYYKG